MRVIPVLDVLDGVAVHAVRGNRKEYRPLKSVLCESADPFEIAAAFKNLGFSWLYVADLNAIMGNGDNLDVLQKISGKTGLVLLVDAGISNSEKAELVMRNYALKVVVGTETLSDMSFVQEAVCAFGAERVFVSLDMRNGQVLAGFHLEESQSPLSLLLEFQRMGLTRVILLDLARVGSGEGVDCAFLSDVLEKVELEVFVGGGVRDMGDLLKLNRMGASGVLMASALHSGKISVSELLAAGLVI